MSQWKPAKFQCICYCRHVKKSVCTEYVVNNYEFQKYIVSGSLGNINTDFQGNRYICLQCQNKLIGTTNENPIMGFHSKNTLMKAGANFLKSLDERPEYVCTSCHQMLFWKTFRLFKISGYDQTNEVVQNVCLIISFWKWNKSQHILMPWINTIVRGQTLYMTLMLMELLLFLMNLFVFTTEMPCVQESLGSLIKHEQMD